MPPDKEKSDELDVLRKTFQKSLDAMQSSLENETRAKGEAVRQKKKLDADMNELTIALEHANASNQETQTQIRRYQVRQNILKESHTSSILSRRPSRRANQCWRTSR